jgi:hypothetical protein
LTSGVTSTETQVPFANEPERPYEVDENEGCLFQVTLYSRHDVLPTERTSKPAVLAFLDQTLSVAWPTGP